MSDSSATPWAVADQPPLSMGFPRQEYWSGLPFPSPGDLPDPRIKPKSPALQAESLPLSHLGSHKSYFYQFKNRKGQFSCDKEGQMIIIYTKKKGIPQDRGSLVESLVLLGQVVAVFRGTDSWDIS